MSILFLLLSNFFLSSSSAAEHDIHISKALIEYDETEQALQITLHIFLDDLEAILIEGGAPTQLNLCTKKEHEEGNAFVEKYLRSKFQLTVNGKVANYNYLGKEISEDFLATWCYVEIPNVSKLESLQIKSSILMDLYDDQRNIIQIKTPNQRPQFFMLDAGHQEESINY
ncbi:MAG: DUF6702 family protein [Bacteroidota bacterium]